MSLPDPIVETHAGVIVVRDDLLPGGTKRRAIEPIISGCNDAEFVYAGPAYGYAQLATALACRDHGRRATLFVAKRSQPHELTLRAHKAGAQVVQVPFGRLNVIQSRARAYCKLTGAVMLPFGLDCDEARDAIAGAARRIGVTPREVWNASGSGCLTRALQLAWPSAGFNAVVVGKMGCEIGAAKPHMPPESFDDPATVPPPFPSSVNYDAKVWRFCSNEPGEATLFWNVAS